MDHSNAFTANEIERLIAGSALSLLWEKLCAPWSDDWWRTEDEGEFEAAYIERETTIATLERVVLETCDTAYNEIAEGVAARGALQDEIAEGRLIVVFDGLSLREACYLKSQLRERRRKVELRYSFSALPSSTEAFCQKHLGVTSFSGLQNHVLRGFPADYCPDETRLNIPRASGALIAVGLPDPLLHRGRRGRTQVVSLQSAFTRTWAALEKILEAASDKEIVVTTDHGYIYTGRNYADPLWSLGGQEKGRQLAQVFGGGRAVDAAKIGDVQRVEWRDYVFCDGNQCLVKGRWLWPSSGAGEGVTHGGLSLIECLVPILTIQPTLAKTVA